MSKVVNVDGRRITVPDDATPDEIDAIYSASPQPSVPPSTMPSTVSSQEAKVDLKRRAASALPTAGGVVGGIGGGILGIPGGPPGIMAGSAAGSTLLGGAGEAGRQAIMGEGMDPNRIAFEGAMQGIYDVTGQVGGRAVGAAAKGLMRGAMGVGKPIAGEVKIGRSTFPDPVPVALEDGLTVSSGGAEKAKRLAKEANNEVNRLLNIARLQGKKAKTSDITKYAFRVLGDRSLEPSERATIGKKLIEFLDDKGADVDPALLRDIKQKWSEVAESDVATAAEAPMKRFGRAMAKGAREEMGKIKGVSAADARLQRLMGAERALKRAAGKKPGKVDIMKPGTYPVLNLIDTPKWESRVARFMNSSAFKEFAKQSPRGAAELYRQLTLVAEPDKTEVQR